MALLTELGAQIEVSREGSRVAVVLFGEVQGINGGADFYGKTPDELRHELQAA